MAGGGVGGLVRQLFGSRLLRNHHPPPPPPNAAQAHEVKAQQLFLPSFPVVLCPGLIFLRNQRVCPPTPPTRSVAWGEISLLQGIYILSIFLYIYYYLIFTAAS